jgi:predicted naringenin-chalcone synthase
MGAATPPHLTQDQTGELIKQLACRTAGQRGWFQRVLDGSGIETRGIVLAGERGIEGLREFYPPPKDASDRGPTTAARMARYAIEAPALAEIAARRALDNAHLKSDSITHLMTVSCTGFFAPGLDAALIERLHLSPAVRRLHIGFMGCHGAFNALAAARDAVLADRNAKVLVCSVELCSLHLAYDFDPGQLIANGLFGDGAAAVVVGGRRRGDSSAWILRDCASRLLPDSGDAMTWRIGDHGFQMTLSPGVPNVIRRHVREWIEPWLARHDLTLADISNWAIHPGGPKILSAAAEALGLPETATRYSRAILREHGNLSSASVLFILQRIGSDDGAGKCLAIGLGPGLMAEGMMLER